MRAMHWIIIVFLILPLVGKEAYWQVVAEGYERPVDVKPLPKLNGEKLFFVLEQGGRLFLTDFSQRKDEVLDWSKKVTRRANEQGFLCLALAPDFNRTGRAYFNINNKRGDTEIWRYTFDLNNLSQASIKPELLSSFKQPYKNHNGGWLGFGPDGMLYIATGDGGSKNDPKNHAQNLNSYLGKILRIDVSGETGYRIPHNNPFVDLPQVKPEVFAYGLRNPWRCAWHNDLLIMGDVGQYHFEEVNAVKIKDLRGGNFGWRLREGEVATPQKKVGGNAPSGEIKPILVYPHATSEQLGGMSITGGVYYDGKIQEYAGRYFFADYVLPRIWSIKLSKGGSADIQIHEMKAKPNNKSVGSISSFSLGHDGELYLISLRGEIYRLSK